MSITPKRLEMDLTVGYHEMANFVESDIGVVFSDFFALELIYVLISVIHLGNFNLWARRALARNPEGVSI